MILILGAKGSMGRRYKAILDSLGVASIGVDKDPIAIPEYAIKASIIATPTETHSLFIKECAQYGPVLCEKPLSTSMSEVNEILDFVRDENIHFSMMNQYALLDDSRSHGHTSYNYYNTGKDGLYWDCMQIIGAARSTVEIKNDSPVWKCSLNGKILSSSHMDLAYYDFVREWLTFRKKHDINYLRDMHNKAASFGQRN